MSTVPRLPAPVRNRRAETRPACDVWQCELDGVVSGYFSGAGHGRPGTMCKPHAYDPRNGFMPRPYVGRDHDRYFPGVTHVTLDNAR